MAKSSVSVWVTGSLFIFFLLALLGAVLAFKNAWTSLPAVISLSTAGGASIICLILFIVFLVRYSKQRPTAGYQFAVGGAVEAAPTTATNSTTNPLVASTATNSTTNPLVASTATSSTTNPLVASTATNSTTNSSTAANAAATNAASATNAATATLAASATNAATAGTTAAAASQAKINTAVNAVRPMVQTANAIIPPLSSVQQFFPYATSASAQQLYFMALKSLMYTTTMNETDPISQQLITAVPALQGLVSSLQTASANLTSDEKVLFVAGIQALIVS